MKMKNQNYIKLVFISLLITSCFLFPKPKKQGELNIKDSNDVAPKVKVTFKTGSDNSLMGVAVFLKTSMNDLLDINGKKVLDGVKYSFTLAPITLGGKIRGELGFSKVLVLEVKKGIEDKIVIKEFYFVNKNGVPIGLEFAVPADLLIPHKKDSKEEGYKYAYNRGFINWKPTDIALGKTINAYYDHASKNWKYMYLKIVLEKEFQGKREYIVKINPYIFNELVKHFKKTYIDNNDDKTAKKDYENILNEQIPSLPVNDN